MSLKIDNYRLDELSEFDIQWIATPEIPGGAQAQNRTSYIIPPGSLSTSKLYVLSVTITHKDHPTIEAIESDVIKTQAPPTGGIVTITPGEAVIGDVLTASISGWNSPNGIVWALWQTKDGTTKDKKVTNEWLPMSR